MIDPDLHAIRFTWTLDGAVVGRYEGWTPARDLLPGTYRVTLTRSTTTAAHPSATRSRSKCPRSRRPGLLPRKLSGRIPRRVAAVSRIRPPHLGRANVASRRRGAEAGRRWLTPPTISTWDSSRIRRRNTSSGFGMKAEGDHWANDSVFVQFTGSTDAWETRFTRSGRPRRWR